MAPHLPDFETLDKSPNSLGWLFSVCMYPLPKIYSLSFSSLCVPQKADLCGLHHLGNLAFWFPADSTDGKY